MDSKNQHVRVLYSFPHKIGAGRICQTAWQQVDGLTRAGAEVLLFPGCTTGPLPRAAAIEPTLARGRVRVSYKIVGTLRACAIHDWIVARRLRQLAGKVDIVHAWPLGGLRTFKVAKYLGIPTVLERQNCHTAFAYEVVQRECQRIGVVLPKGSEHAYNSAVLARELEEYEATSRLLCPSVAVTDSFLQKGFSRSRLARHIYGFDETRFFPGKSPAGRGGLTVMFAGFAAVRKGLHIALAAWLNSPASEDGKFLVAGGIMPQYAEKIREMLLHPSVDVLGHRTDIPELMRSSDAMVLPSLEEGFGLVCIEAMASGSVPLVSEACTDVCCHMDNSLVHPVGDVTRLTEHFTMIHSDRELLRRLRAGALQTAPTVTWTAAGRRLLDVYRDVIGPR